MTHTTREFGRVAVELTSLDKIMYPDEGLTKGDVIEYYTRIAETMLPYMRGRPLNMQRFPNGINEPGFYQKEVPPYFPEWITRVDVEVLETGELQSQVMCNDQATLVYLANQACITPHLWLSPSQHLHHPDKLIFDLDPPDDNKVFATVVDAAQKLRAVLQEKQMRAYVMTTGSHGLHVVVPLDGHADFDASRAFARSIADELAQRNPDHLTTETRLNERHGRLFLDYLRNAYGQTAVAPYALRPFPGAPVATPLEWPELDNPELTSRTYRMDNIFRRPGQKHDPWRSMDSHRVDLAGVIDRTEAHRSAVDHS